MRKDQIIIFLLVGIMLFSVFGLGLVLIIDNANKSDSTQQVDEALSEQEKALQQAQQEALAAAQCQRLPDDPNATPMESPEVFIPDSDVTELSVTDLKVGTGNEVTADSCVVVHYHGTLARGGSVFDSSYERGQPARFSLSGVIQGWQQGMLGMREGGIRRLVIPSNLGYGEAGNPPIIGPNADLVFVVELVRIES